MADGVTFVHVRSESGDDYYLAFAGVLDDVAAADAVSAEFADTDDADCIYIAHVERWQGGDDG